MSHFLFKMQKKLLHNSSNLFHQIKWDQSKTAQIKFSKRYKIKPN